MCRRIEITEYVILFLTLLFQGYAGLVAPSCAFFWCYTVPVSSADGFSMHFSAQLAQLVRLRWGFIIVAALGLAIALGGLGIELPVVPLVLCLSGLTALNVYLSWRTTQAGLHHDAFELAFQLCLDVGALGILLFFTGGAGNPVVTLYLLIVAIAAVLLPPRLAWLIVAWAVAVYSFLMWFYLPLPGIPGDPLFVFRIHLLGMWATFGLAAMLITALLLRMATQLRQREQQIAAMREAQLRDERLLAIGTLAAGTAHELGTPLSTLRLLLDEMQLDYAAQHPLLEQDLALASEQVNTCKRALMRLAEQVNGQPPAVESLATQFNRILEHWASLRPHAHITTTLQLDSAPTGHLDPTFAPALLNLLNNAVDASSETVTLTAEWQPNWLEVTIANRGPSLSEEQLNQLGQPMRSNKPDGMGIGVFLAHASFERLGGEVSLVNRQGGGVLATVKLPWPAQEGNHHV